MLLDPGVIKKHVLKAKMGSTQKIVQMIMMGGSKISTFLASVSLPFQHKIVAGWFTAPLGRIRLGKLLRIIGHN